MAQKDYVSRSRTSNRSHSGKHTGKNNKLIGIALLIILFIAALYFLSHYKPHHNQPTASPASSAQDKEKNTPALPPKPEERWSYIKELEGVQNGHSSPQMTGSAAQSPQRAPIPAPLNNEQRQILQQMQAEQPAASVPQPQPKVKAVIPTVTPPTPTKSAPTTPTAPKTTTAAPQTKKTNSRWLLQCGSFQHPEQAESVRAKLAFAGIESRIRQDKGWSRIQLGPYQQHQQAINLQKKIANNAQTHCIVITLEG